MLLRRQLIIFCCFLIPVVTSCTLTLQPAPTDILNVVRLSPPALLQFSGDLQQLNEIPLALPPGCGLFDIFSHPHGTLLAVELSCSFGQSVHFLDVESGSVTPAFPEADSHFLAWSSDGMSAFLRVNSTGNPQILRAFPGGKQESVPITELTYDIAANPDRSDFTFAFSRGLGFGSEIWLATENGEIVEPLYADEFNYISFARWSPDGRQVAFIKIPDSQTPFTVGELWLMNADGSNVRKLADADAGHGYAAHWSPDGLQLAFVVRANPEDTRANESAEALISNLFVVNIKSREITQVTQFTEGRAETPHWSPDGNKLVFQYVLNGRIDLQVVDLSSGEIDAVLTQPACCPSWMRK